MDSFSSNLKVLLKKRAFIDEPTEGCIDGSVITITLIKSRTNATKRSVPLIFNKTEGRFDEILS